MCFQKGGDTVAVTPYTIKSTNIGISVSYGDTRRYANATRIYEAFHSDFLFIKRYLTIYK